MLPQNRPLWQILLSVSSNQQTQSLTCDECFIIIDYLAQLASQTELDETNLQQLTRKHLKSCPDCRDRYMKRLRKWESLQHRFTQAGAA